MAHAVAVDIGGTFTDLVAYDHENGTVAYTKSPTTYGNLVDGVLDCFAKAKLDPASAHFVNHGTTLVINALIQRKGAKAALVTTQGFRDILEIARGNRPDPFDLHYRRDEPLIPRALRFERQGADRKQRRDRHRARCRGARGNLAVQLKKGSASRWSPSSSHEFLRQSGARRRGRRQSCAPASAATPM